MHYVYTLLGEDDVCLYVGVTSDPSSRLGVHRREKPWWEDVEDIRLVAYETRREAECAEAQAIRSRSPTHNKVASHVDKPPQASSPEGGRVSSHLVWVPDDYGGDPETSEPILTAAQVAERLEVTRSTVLSQRSRGRWPEDGRVGDVPVWRASTVDQLGR